jgi:hypothetical protein
MAILLLGGLHLLFEKICILLLLFGYHCVTSSILFWHIMYYYNIMYSKMFEPIVVLLRSLFIFCSRLPWALRPYA